MFLCGGKSFDTFDEANAYFKQVYENTGTILGIVEIPDATEMREKMIDRLISEGMDTILNHGYDDFLYNILLNGFTGYENMTDMELQTELSYFGIELGDE